MSDLTEQVESFGSAGHLTGVLTVPAHPSRIACVLVNAGMVPKFGAYRMYPELARALAKTGITTLRFDLSGMGDSRLADAGLPLAFRMRVDLKSAVEQVLSRGDFDGVIVGGLCSGGEDALRFAEHDDRVKGVFLIDPFAYRTTGFRLHNALFRLVRRSLRAAKLYRPFAYPEQDSSLVHYVYMPEPESRRILSTLIKRRARVHFLYTGGKAAEFNHPGQLQHMFAGLEFANQVTVSLLRETEHMPVLSSERGQLIGELVTWAQRVTG